MGCAGVWSVGPWGLSGFGFGVVGSAGIKTQGFRILGASGFQFRFGLSLSIMGIGLEASE